VSATDATALAAWEAEALVGQRPGTQAWSSGSPCAAGGQDLGNRWPLFAQAAAGRGICLVAGAPLGLHAARLGVICA
jgi:hypothetical protein